MHLHDISGSSHLDIDIDVDVSHLIEHPGDEPILISDAWYLLSQRREGRSPIVQAKLEKMFNNAMMFAQWQATRRRALDRRRAIRVPILSRVHIDGLEQHMTATDISLSGIRCSGEPRAPVMDIEFHIPGLAFPVDARAEVVSYKESPVIPLVGLRFASIDRPYREHIAAYVDRRRARQFARAA